MDVFGLEIVKFDDMAQCHWLF